MGLWAAVKYAINGTLGMSEFKPLNELTADRIEIAENNIRQDTLGYFYQASDNVIVTKAINYSTSNEDGNRPNGTVLGTVSFAYSGKLRFKITATNRNEYNQSTITLAVKIADTSTVQGSITATLRGAGSSAANVGTVTATAVGDIQVEAGVKYQLIYTIAREGLVSDMSISGTKVPYNEIHWY